MTKKPSTFDLAVYASDPLRFFCDLQISRRGGSIRFGDAGVMGDFQREFFREVSPCLLAVASGSTPPRRGFFCERTKGASKDSDLAAIVKWLLLFSPRPLLVECAAADQDQAKEVQRAMGEWDRLNPWLADRIENQRFKTLCPATGSELVYLTADAGGAHGSRPDVTIMNELSHVGDEQFASTVLDNATKRPDNLTFIMTNAGFKGTWQWRWREFYRTSERWFWHAVTVPAPWLAPADIAEARARNTPSRYARLWEGQWSAGTGDAIDAGDVTACIRLDGPAAGPESGILYLAGLDLATKRDHAALVVVGVEPGSGRVFLADCRSWAPGPGGVNLIEVREECLEVADRFGLCWLGYDPTQAVLLAAELAVAGVPVEEVPFTGPSLNRMARSLLEAFRDRRVDLYQHPGLIADLFRLTIAERSYGYRLESTRDADGHADRATALAIVLPTALELSTTAIAEEPDWDNMPRQAIA